MTDASSSDAVKEFAALFGTSLNDTTFTDMVARRLAGLPDSDHIEHGGNNLPAEQNQ